MEWKIRRAILGEWREYRLFQDNEVVAFAKWRPHGDSAELHNTISKMSKSVLKKAREKFNTMIKPDIKAAGLKFIVVADTEAKVSPLMAHYWRFMGFDFTCDWRGHTCAVMEV